MMVVNSSSASRPPRSIPSISKKRFVVWTVKPSCLDSSSFSYRAVTLPLR